MKNKYDYDVFIVVNIKTPCGVINKVACVPEITQPSDEALEEYLSSCFKSLKLAVLQEYTQLQKLNLVEVNNDRT